MTNTGSPKPRHLVLVDIENLLATPSPLAADIELAQGYLMAELDLDGDEHVIVACSHHAAPEVAFGWKGSCRRRWRSGADGADLALLDVLEQEPVLGRYDAVTIVSGDGIFAEALSRLGNAGIATTVVSISTSLSTRSRLACHCAREIVDAPWITAECAA